MVGDPTVVRGEIWWAATPGGERPVLVLTRDPVANRIGVVVVAACTRTVRGLMSELPLGPDDGMTEDCVASFDNLHTLRKDRFRRRIATLPPDRDSELCTALDAALGCPR
ncbi:type II toxin-antitoxin system PemK/MazF family toxin [soil metagenome]